MDEQDKQQLQVMAKGLGELATVVRDIAAYVYKNDMKEYGEEEEYETVEKGHGAMMGEEEEEFPMTGKMPAMEEEEMPLDEEMPEDLELMGGRKGKHMDKGYADAAMETADEEDSPFDEQQSSIQGNKPSPAGAQMGSREDETFNMQFSAVMRELRGLRKDLEASGVAVTKAVVPGVGGDQRGRTVSRGGAETVTEEDLHKQVKALDWKQINRMRLEVGDLAHGL